jgi:hypothetical protein
MQQTTHISRILTATNSITNDLKRTRKWSEYNIAVSALIAVIVTILEGLT